jgi:hypothetical protein
MLLAHATRVAAGKKASALAVCRALASFFSRRQAPRVFVLTFVWVAGIARVSTLQTHFINKKQ